MEVADRIAVMDHSRIEQVATPRDLYESPSNPFVMGFVGPLTVLDGREVRPHEISLDTAPVDGAVRGFVTRVIHLGFEVRVEIAAADHSDLWVQLSRHDPIVSALGPGVPVWACAVEAPMPPRSSTGRQQRRDDPVAA